MASDVERNLKAMLMSAGGKPEFPQCDTPPMPTMGKGCSIKYMGAEDFIFPSHNFHLTFVPTQLFMQPTLCTIGERVFELDITFNDDMGFVFTPTPTIEALGKKIKIRGTPFY